MSAPSISVIVPVYNAEATLRDCINSILAHQGLSMEILLIDDGSQDASAKICDSYAASDSRIHAFHRQNQGVSAARNFGLSMAQSEWIAFVDSDDQVGFGYFPSDGRHGSDLLMQNWRFRSSESYEEHFNAATYHGDDFRSFVNANLHHDALRVVWGKMLKRSIIEQHRLRFDTRIRLGEDTLFLLAYLSHCQSLEVLATSDYLYYRPADWHLHKHYISHQDFCLYIDTFWSLYQKSGFQSPALLGFIYNFFFWRSNPNDSLWQTIRINAYPTVIKMKEMSDGSSWSEKMKRVIFKTISRILYK